MKLSDSDYRFVLGLKALILGYYAIIILLNSRICTRFFITITLIGNYNIQIKNLYLAFPYWYFVKTTVHSTPELVLVFH